MHECANWYVHILLARAEDEFTVRHVKGLVPNATANLCCR